MSNLTSSSSNVYTGLTSFLNNDDTAHTGYPQAYINYIFLDDQFNYVSSLSGTVLAASANNPANQMNLVALGSKLALNRSGYLYIWVSNQTSGWDVYFDNLAVQYQQGPVLEENHYYPFGLTMSAICDKAVKTNYEENKFRFNSGTELQNKEFSDGTGLEIYDAGFRRLDPQLGRFLQIDPLADRSATYGTYTFGSDRPTGTTDPSGLKTAPPGVSGSQFADQIQNEFGFDDVDGSSPGGSGNAGPIYQGNGAYQLPDGQFVDQATAVAYVEAKYGDGVTTYGSLAQALVIALQQGIATANSNTSAHFLLIGGWDYGNTGISQQSLKIIGSVLQYANVSVQWFDPLDPGPTGIAKSAAYLATQFSGVPNLYIYGYSLGGAIALDLCRDLNATNTPVTLLITVDAAEGGLSFLIDRTVPPNVTINYNFYQTNLSSIGSHGDPNVAVNPTCTTVINFDMTNNSFYNQATGQNEIVNHGNMSQATLGPVISILASYLFQYY